MIFLTLGKKDHGILIFRLPYKVKHRYQKEGLKEPQLGGGFKYFCLFSPRNPGEMLLFEEHIFQMG